MVCDNFEAELKKSLLFPIKNPFAPKPLIRTVDVVEAFILNKNLERSKSERKKIYILHINVYMWNLEKWFRRTYFQGRNRDADIENRHADTAAEEEDG